MEVMRIIKEKKEDEIEYGIEKREGKKIDVYEIGGGNLEVQVMEIGEGVFEVK